MIKYLGSKRALLPFISQVLGSIPEVQTFGDLFSGTSRVGHEFKKQGYEVFANDYNQYAYELARVYVEIPNNDDNAREAEKVISHLRSVGPSDGWFTKTYARDSRFFQPENAAKIEAIREEIDALSLSPDMRSIALVSLMEAADRVDSTCGIQMAYIKKWSKRSYKPLDLRMPVMFSGIGHAHCGDTNEWVKEHSLDLAYIDPPYNQHSYLGNYHIWETLVKWDNPEVYGVAQKRVECKTRKSDYNSKVRCKDAFSTLIENTDARVISVSFSVDSFLPGTDIREILSTRGEVISLESSHPKYIGSKTGVYSPAGTKVGRPVSSKTTEVLYLVATDSSSPTQRDAILNLKAD